MNKIPSSSKQEPKTAETTNFKDKNADVNQTISKVFKEATSLPHSVNSLPEQNITTSFTFSTSTNTTHTSNTPLSLHDLCDKNQKDLESYLCKADMNPKTAKELAKILVDLKSKTTTKSSPLLKKELIEAITMVIATQTINASVLKEIVDLFIEIDCDTTLAYMDKFGIKDLIHLLEIAKLCASKNIAATAQHIKKFKIKDKKALIEFIKFCGKLDLLLTQQHFKNFAITEVEDLIELAEFFAEEYAPKTKTVLTTAKYIKNFEIDEQIKQRALPGDRSYLLVS